MKGHHKTGDFGLDPRLKNDCHVMGHLPMSELLLMNNAHYCWFILVPRVEATEFHELEPPVQATLMREVTQIASFIQHARPATDKVNIAMIGNIVRQMHIHVVGRSTRDPAWPGVVWGNQEQMPYADAAIDTIKEQLLSESIPGYSQP